MASNIYLVPGIGGETVYLTGVGGANGGYTGSGTPWQLQTTSPYQIGMSDIDGRWTPQAPQANLVFGGGPPFRSGQALHFKNFPNVTETVTIQGYASSYDNAVALRRLLYQVLNTRVRGVPTLLAVQPNGSTNTAYAEIYSADIQESERFLNDEARLPTKLIRLLVTWVRSPWFGRGPSDGDGGAIVNGATVNNTGTGTPDNLETFSTVTGELNYEGQPAHIQIAPGQVGPYTIFYVAVVHRRTYDTTGAGALSTSSTTGTQTALGSLTVADPMSIEGLKIRVLFRFTNNTSNVQVRVEMRANTSGTTLYTGPWITPTSGSATLYDMGEVPIDAIKQAWGGAAANGQFYIGYRSTNGASATTTLGYTEVLSYYTFARVDASGVTSSGANAKLRLIGYHIDGTNRAFLPLNTPTAVITSSSTTVYDVCTLRGSYPLAIEGGKLYVAWMKAGNVHATTDTATVSVNYAPLWLTLRGGG